MDDYQRLSQGCTAFTGILCILLGFGVTPLFLPWAVLCGWCYWKTHGALKPVPEWRDAFHRELTRARIEKEAELKARRYSKLYRGFSPIQVPLDKQVVGRPVRHQTGVYRLLGPANYRDPEQFTLQRWNSDEREWSIFEGEDVSHLRRPATAYPQTEIRVSLSGPEVSFDYADEIGFPEYELYCAGSGIGPDAGPGRESTARTLPPTRTSHSTPGTGPP